MHIWVDRPVIANYKGASTGDKTMTAADKTWHATHPDFRMMIEGRRYILRCVKGATVPVPIETA